MFISDTAKFIRRFICAALIALFVSTAGSVGVEANSSARKLGGLGIIKGIVRDSNGNPIPEAMVAIFRVGTSKLLKQVRSSADGSFLAKILPGTYTILAVAQGFDPVTLSEVEVNRSAELVYRFNLEPSGNGRTTPEKRMDRGSSKWVIRAAQSRRSVYQNREGNSPIVETGTDEDSSGVVAQQSVGVADLEETTKRRTQMVVETFGGVAGEGFAGINFAALQPIGENAELVIAAQATSGLNAPRRLDTNFKFRPDADHQVRINTSIAQLGSVRLDNQEKQLGQFSVQALDEWRVKNGVILVLGFDYSRFMGAGEDFALSPRLGLQFDLDSRTRFRSAYTTQTEDKNWQRAIEMEDTQVVFREPVAMQDIVIENDKPQLNKSRRLEFGIERILDNSSSIEGNIFFDLSTSRGVGLVSMPFNFLGDDASEFVANQQGRAQGIRVVYSRRLSSRFSTAAGFAFGTGQRLSDKAITDPSRIFETDYFRTFFGQFNADLRTGTHVRTIFRLSPEATVFAIDPFQGRLAIYDPSLSVMLTQSLPTMGLPIRAEAVIDARNLFDYQTGINGEEGSLRLGSQRRILRGGIMVRF